MTPDATTKAASFLANHRSGPVSTRPQMIGLRDNCRPVNLDDAYDVQEAARSQLADGELGAQAGWKIGCTTPVMQEYLSIPHPCAGTLYEKRLFQKTATLSASDFYQIGLECEIAVRLAAPIEVFHGEETDPDVVKASIDAIMASIEVVEHRFEDFTTVGTPTLVADDFFSVGCITGSPVPPDDISDLSSLEGGFLIDGHPAPERGRGDAILGHPLNALTWLAKHAVSRGTPLQAGQTITLGSVVKTIYPTAGSTIETQISDLPPASVRLI